MKIGICGLGFVGNAINEFFKKTSHLLYVYDKYKNIGSINDMVITDMVYLCLPTLYSEELSTYDMSEIDNTIMLLNDNNYKGIIIIKSTILPTYTQSTNNIYPALNIVHNPEFLSARTAIEDFENQKHIIIGYTFQSFPIINIIIDFYSLLFPQSKISSVDSKTSALTKMACNSFYASKIQYFTEIYLLCEKLDIKYNTVIDLMLLNNWINPMHTSIPGPDNIISFGGACLPKDIRALNQLMVVNSVENKVIAAVIEENTDMRKLI